MSAPSSAWVKAGVTSCLLACAGDVVVPEILAGSYPGYNPVMQSESILGAAGSPVAGWFTAWSVCLALLFFVFAWGLQQAFWPTAKRMSLAAWLLMLYAIGEGLGSGIFPFNHSDGVLTVMGKLHAAMSVMGSAALYLLPLVWLLRPPVQGPRLRAISWATLLLGGLFMLLFGAAKAGLCWGLGLWQRAYLVVYYVYLLTLAWAMYRSMNRERSI
ncbi:MAG: DUF998 domain-containing protein [Flavobacteriales bacterium]